MAQNRWHSTRRILGIGIGLGLVYSAALAQPAPTPADLPPPAVVSSNSCVPVDGMTFELSGSETLLVRKGNASVALIRTSQFLPAGLTSMRFMAGELCARGPKSQFVINDLLYAVSNIYSISGDTSTRIAKVNESGTAATVGR